ncbi:MAG: TOBE domain-containing protein [Chthoniobacterales bacterium]
MEQSIRNQIPGTVKRMVSDKAVSEVVIETPIGDLAAIITTRSVREMELGPGMEVFALIKATNVSVAKRVSESASKTKPKPKRKAKLKR